MSLPITITYTFASQSGSIPVAQIDANFTVVANAVNGIGNGTNALSNVSITGGTITNATISGLAADITVSDGGTGLGSLTSGGALTGNGTGSVIVVAPGASGNVLTSNGTAFISQAGGLPTQLSGGVLTSNGSAAVFSRDSTVRARATFTNGGNTTPTLGTGSVNIASATRTGTGQYTITFSAALASSNYQVFALAYNATYASLVCGVSSKSTGTFSLGTYVATVGFVDFNSLDIIVFGGF